MNTRPLLFCAAVSLLACSCSALRSLPPAQVSPASQFATTIRRIERADPGSPASLDAQLAYAGFLLSGPSRFSCGEHLNLAQEQIGSVAANPKTRVMFPDGWALLADLEYRQHLARAACASKMDRRDDLLAAVEAARRAVRLYRDGFDYRSMVVMQFDVATTRHALRDDTAALSALKEALRMDREYGFLDDARENYGLLLTWRGEPAGAAEVAKLMRDFPRRRVTFEFGWHPIDTRIALDRRRALLSDGRIVHARATEDFVGSITADQSGGWTVSYTHRLSSYDPGVWPHEPAPEVPELVFSPAPLPALDFKVTAAGGFDGVTDPKAFAGRLAARTSALIRVGALSGHDGASVTNDVLARVASILSPGILAAATAENYQLETAMWIGAKLEQGVWYGITAPLSLPGVSQLVVPQRIEFSFSRRVPCTSAVVAKKCAEIVIHATPNQTTLDNLLADVAGGSPQYRYMDYGAVIDARIVIDPATLLPYTREERIYWYVSLGKSAADKILQSEHVVATTRYTAAAVQAADTR
ncbi:MAG: hypothetical protein WAM52_13085 [Steroidobacteraceae bacterium]